MSMFDLHKSFETSELPLHDHEQALSSLERATTLPTSIIASHHLIPKLVTAVTKYVSGELCVGLQR